MEKLFEILKSFLFNISCSVGPNVSFGHDDHPHLTVVISDQPYRGLLDSGSCISVLGSDASETFLRAGSYLNRDSDIKNIYTANDSNAEVMGFIHLPVTLYNTTKIIKFYVVPHVSTPLIFGVDVCKAFKLAPKIFGGLTL